MQCGPSAVKSVSCCSCHDCIDAVMASVMHECFRATYISVQVLYVTCLSSQCICMLLQSSMLEERDLGVLMAVVTLLLGIVSRNYEGQPAYRPVMQTMWCSLAQRLFAVLQNDFVWRQLCSCCCWKLQTHFHSACVSNQMHDFG